VSNCNLPIISSFTISNSANIFIIRFSRGSTIQATESAAVLPCSNINFDGEMTIDTENSDSLPSKYVYYLVNTKDSCDF
jgi:hypothetical protein